MPSKINPGVLANGKLFSNRALTRRQLENDLNAGLQNVKNYSDSTVGDGTTDARAAIAAADTAGPVVLPPGTYAVASNLTLTKKITFLPGAKLKPASGVTVTLSDGYVANDEQHVFDISDAGVIVLTNKVPVCAEHWGAIGDGVNIDTPAVQAAINATKSVKFLQKHYRCTVTCDPANQPVFLVGNNTVITAADSNEFSVTLHGDLPHGVCRISNIHFRGDNPSHGHVPGRTRHGLQICVSANVVVDNCWFTHCDIGYYNQTTIISALNSCYFSACRIGAYYTSRSSVNGTLSFLTPHGQTVVSADPLYGGVHPAEVMLTSVKFDQCEIGFLVDSPGNGWSPSRDFKIDKPLFQYCTVGMLLLPDIGHAADSTFINNPWFEGQDVTKTVSFDGVTYSGCDVYIEGMQAVQHGGWISSIRARTTAIYRMENVSWTTSGIANYDLYDVQDKACVTGEIVNAVGRIPFRVRAGIPTQYSQGPVFECSPMISKGYSMRDNPNLIFSKSCEADDLPTLFFGGTSLGVINDGPGDVNESLGYLATAGNGVMFGSLMATPLTQYLVKFALKAYCPIHTFTVNAGTDVFTSEGHPFVNNMEVRLFTTTTLPGNTSLATSYYIIEATANTFKLSATVGGLSIDVTDIGTGTHTVQQITTFDLRTQNVDTGAFIGAVNIPTTTSWKTWCVNSLAPASIVDSSFFIGGVTPTVVRAYLIAQMYVAQVDNFADSLALIDSQQFFSKLPYSESVVRSTYDSDIELTVASANGYLESDTFISHALSGDFEVEFHLPSLSINTVFGVQASSSAAVSYNYESLLFGVQCPNTSNVRVWKSGSAVDHAVAWTNGKIRIVRSGTNISLFIDDTEIAAAETTGATTADLYPAATFGNASPISLFLRNVDGTVEHVGDNVSISKIKNSTGYQNVLDYSHSIIGVNDGITDARGVIATADAAGPIVLPPGTYAIASNITLTNKVTFVPGAKLKPASGVTVTLSDGYVANEDQHVFDISDAGVIVLTNKVPVCAEHWGAVGDGVTNDSSAIQAAVNASNGNLKLLPRHYIGTVVVNPVNGTNIIGDRTRWSAATNNTFALTIAGEFPSSLCRVSGIEFYGNETKSIHGLQIAAGSAVFVDHCWFSFCGIGLLNNNSIDLRFAMMWFRQCYVAVYMTSRLAATTGLVIEDIAGQDVTIAECVTGGSPFAASHPSEILFDGIIINLCDIGFVFDQPANTILGGAQDFIFLKPLIQATPLGAWFKGDATGRRMVGAPCKFLSVWNEGGNPAVSKIVDGDTTDGCDIRIDGGCVIYEGGLLNSFKVKGDGQLYLRDTSLYPLDGIDVPFEVDSTASVIADAVYGTGLMNFRCEFGIPALVSYGILHKWHGPTQTSLEFVDNPRLLNTYSCIGTEIPTIWGATDLGVVSDGVLETRESHGVAATYLQGWLIPVASVTVGKLYSVTFAIKAYCPEIVFTTNHTTETFSATGHGLRNGQEMNVFSDDTLPDGLVEDTNYYVINRTDDTFQLSTTVGGSALPLADNGTGAHTIKQVTEFDCMLINATPDKWLNTTYFPVTDQWEHWCASGLPIDTGTGDIYLWTKDSPTGVVRAFLISAVQCLEHNNEEQLRDFNQCRKFYTDTLPSEEELQDYVNRANHTGTQNAATIFDLKGAVLDSVGTTTYNQLLASASSLLNGDANLDGTGDANDLIGAYNGTWGGTAVYGSPPTYNGKSFVLDGAKYITQVAEAGDFSDSTTVAAWVKPNALSGRIVSKRADATAAWELYLESDGSVRFYDGSSYPSAAGAITLNTWHHVLVVLNGASSRIYIDGVASGSAFTPTITTNSQVLNWGRLPAFGGLDYLDGELYQCGVWFGKVFTADEILLISDINLAKLTSIGGFEDLGTLASGTEVFSFNNGSGVAKTIEATGNIALQFVATVPGNYVAIVEMDGTGGHTVTYATTVVGTAPTMNTAANAKTLIPLFYDGTTWFHTPDTPSPKDKAEAVASSATPTFDYSDGDGDTKTHTATSLITPVITMARPGRHDLVITQDATGGREILWPTNMRFRYMAPQPDLTPGKKSLLSWVYDGTHGVADGIQHEDNYIADFDAVGASSTALPITFPDAGTILVKCRLAVATPASKTRLFQTKVSGPDSHYPFTDGLIAADWLRSTRIVGITPSASVNRTLWHWVIVRTDSTDGWDLIQSISSILYTIDSDSHETIGVQNIEIGSSNSQAEIDRVLIFNSRLGDVPIGNVMASTKSTANSDLPSGLLARYELNYDRGGKILQDWSGNGRDITLTAATPSLFVVNSGV